MLHRGDCGLDHMSWGELRAALLEKMLALGRLSPAEGRDTENFVPFPNFHERVYVSHPLDLFIHSFVHSF